MAQDEDVFYLPFWSAFGITPPVGGERYDAILQVEGEETFQTRLHFHNGILNGLWLEPTANTGKEGGIIWADKPDAQLHLSLNLDDDICHGGDWEDLARNLPAGLNDYPELNEANFSWMQELLNFVAGLPTATKFSLTAKD